MAKISAKYKVIYIIDPAQGEEGIAALVEKFKAMVEAEGTLVSLDELGKRRLAYPINDLPEGYYVRMICECKPQLPAELDRVLNITEGVIRHIITDEEVREERHAEPHCSHGPSYTGSGAPPHRHGIAVASFTLAVDRDYAPKDGGQRETDFIDIVAWRSTAEFVSKYFSKGRMAVVSGRLQIRPWEDKDGNKRRSAEGGGRQCLLWRQQAGHGVQRRLQRRQQLQCRQQLWFRKQLRFRRLFCPRRPPAMPLRPARLRRTLPCWRMTMPSSRSKIQPHFPKRVLTKEDYHG